MKIEHPRTNLDPTNRVSTEAAPHAARTGSGAVGDAVRLSSDLRLADEAMRAATEDDGRADRVAHAREMFERGALGGDLDRLADRMIDVLLHSDDIS
jgi:anti-sigma28 factor (negative regulator of flagellin synthesis)